MFRFVICDVEAETKKKICRVVDFFRFMSFYKVVIVIVTRKCQKENENVFFRASKGWLCFLAILKLCIALNVLHLSLIHI